MIGDIDLYKIEKITRIQTEYPQSVCGNEHIFFLIKTIMEVLKHTVYLCHKQYGEKKNIRIEDIKEKHWLAFLNIPFTNLRNPVVRRYVDGFETEEDKQYIKQHKKYRVGMPFLIKALWAREILKDIQKIIEINSPLSEETQKYTIDLTILMINFQSVETKRMKDALIFNKEIEHNRRKKGGLTKGKNSQEFKDRMYEEQKEWFYAKKQQELPAYATDFARIYYHRCKAEHENDSSKKFPFHFSPEKKLKGEGLYGKPELHEEADNALIFLTNLAQKNARKIKEEYSKNKT